MVAEGGDAAWADVSEKGRARNPNQAGKPNPG